jgi:mRNA interferase MazF
MTEATLSPEMLTEGDLVWVDFTPSRGREQGGMRPALVVTDAYFHATRETAIVCPITRNVSPWPTKVILPAGLPVSGAVLVEQIRLVDRATRGFRKLGSAPPEVLEAVREKLADLLKIGV